ncbi:hypothetical protein M011DRAFT_460348 [Sporormia fimetaria CBS 119925]|uniref:Uncharacterized protein n=1 Tax=Sporormia fimetaria CBS 119925 TaxID=1340428 RepID=A0A6A6V609_9PLEO|nr:hypothetical protein M011DRAFT_460348 [Sporormia fimetaria CBS 119925]
MEVNQWKRSLDEATRVSCCGGLENVIQMAADAGWLGTRFRRSEQRIAPLSGSKSSARPAMTFIQSMRDVSQAVCTPGSLVQNRRRPAIRALWGLGVLRRAMRANDAAIEQETRKKGTVRAACGVVLLSHASTHPAARLPSAQPIRGSSSCVNMQWRLTDVCRAAPPEAGDGPVCQLALGWLSANTSILRPLLRNSRTVHSDHGLWCTLSQPPQNDAVPTMLQQFAATCHLYQLAVWRVEELPAFRVQKMLDTTEGGNASTNRQPYLVSCWYAEHAEYFPSWNSHRFVYAGTGWVPTGTAQMRKPARQGNIV